MILGLRTVIYPAPDLAASKAAFTRLLGTEPYFDEPFYVGFEVGGYELGLDPDAAMEDGAVVYWGVPNADEAIGEWVAAGATIRSPVRQVGNGIRTGTVTEPTGSIVGVIENPHFAPPAPPEHDGPGR